MQKSHECQVRTWPAIFPQKPNCMNCSHGAKQPKIAEQWSLNVCPNGRGHQGMGSTEFVPAMSLYFIISLYSLFSNNGKAVEKQVDNNKTSKHKF